MLFRGKILSPGALAAVAGNTSEHRIATLVIAASVLALGAASNAWSAPAATKGAPARKTMAKAANVSRKLPDSLAKPGVSSLVARAWDCDLPTRAPVVWARADHGTIQIKTIRAPGCGRTSMIQAGMFYTSEHGFSGLDKLHILGFSLSHNIDQSLTIEVK